MEITKTIQFNAELRTDENDFNTVYVRFIGSVSNDGTYTVDYYIQDGQNSVFVEHSKDFRQAWQDFNNRIWDEADALIEQNAKIAEESNSTPDK